VPRKALVVDDRGTNQIEKTDQYWYGGAVDLFDINNLTRRLIEDY